jgi:hypothetical protein
MSLNYYPILETSQLVTMIENAPGNQTLQHFHHLCHLGNSVNLSGGDHFLCKIVKPICVLIELTSHSKREY